MEKITVDSTYKQVGALLQVGAGWGPTKNQVSLFRSFLCDQSSGLFITRKILLSSAKKCGLPFRPRTFW